MPDNVILCYIVENRYFCIKFMVFNINIFNIILKKMSLIKNQMSFNDVKAYYYGFNEHPM